MLFLQQNLRRLLRTGADDMVKLPSCCFTFPCFETFPTDCWRTSMFACFTNPAVAHVEIHETGLQKARGYFLSLNYRGISFSQVTINKIIHLAMPDGTQSCQKEESKCLFFYSVFGVYLRRCANISEGI